MSLQRKTAFCVIGSALIALVIASPITFLVIDHILLDLKERQLRSELGDVGNSITNLIGVGLPLAALRRTQHLIEQARSRDPQIGSILVYNPSCEILYSTDLGEIGSTIPSTWCQVDAGGSIRTAEELVAIAPLTNSFGNRAGGVALRFGLANQASQREELALLIGTVSTLALAVTAVLAEWLSRHLLRHLQRGLEVVIADMESMVAGQPPPTLPDVIPAWLLPRYGPFAERVRRTLVELDDYTRDLARMDERG
jgi:hypothetical protein